MRPRPLPFQAALPLACCIVFEPGQPLQAGPGQHAATPLPCRRQHREGSRCLLGTCPCSWRRAVPPACLAPGQLLLACTCRQRASLRQQQLLWVTGLAVQQTAAPRRKCARTDRAACAARRSSSRRLPILSPPPLLLSTAQSLHLSTSMAPPRPAASRVCCWSSSAGAPASSDGWGETTRQGRCQRVRQPQRPLLALQWWRRRAC